MACTQPYLLIKATSKKNVTLKTIAINCIIFLLVSLISIYPLHSFSQLQVANTSLSNYKVVFIELGSVHCMPCKKMQPVMRSIEKRYSTQVKVIFHDVWTPAGKEAAKQFTFNVIPTQIFLDKNNKEYYRHEGYLSEEGVVKVLKLKGVT